MIDEVGFFIMVASPIGLRVMWNGATHVHIKVQHIPHILHLNLLKSC